MPDRGIVRSDNDRLSSKIEDRIPFANRFDDNSPYFLTNLYFTRITEKMLGDCHAFLCYCRSHHLSSEWLHL